MNLDFLLHILHILIISLFHCYLYLKLSDLCFKYLFYTLNNMISFYTYYFKLLFIISLRLITSLIPIFLPFSIKLIFSASLLWLFIILMLSFNSQYFFSWLRIVIKSSWLISLFIKASDIFLSMLFNLLLANVTILLSFFFLFLLVFNSFFTNSVVTENARLQLALIIPTGAPKTVANDAIEILPVATDKQLMIYQNTQKKQYIYWVFCSLVLFL